MIFKKALVMAMAAILFVFTGQALAQSGLPRCTALTNPIFARGTTAVVPLVRRLGAKLAAMTNKHTFIYKYDSACAAIENLTNHTDSAIQSFETAEYYVEDGATGKVATLKCNVYNNQLYDVAISDIFSNACSRSYSDGKDLMPTGYKEFIGPVQGVVPIVSTRNTYNKDIMSLELKDIYVCGADGTVNGFLKGNIADYYDGEGMREMMALMFGLRGNAIKIGLGSNLPYSSMEATDATAIMLMVANTISPESTIGYTSTEVYDENRNLVKAMKLRGPRQLKAYLPDTDISSRDKINIREGRYMLQGALKLVAHVDAAGNPDNPAAKKLIDWLQGNPIEDPTLQLPVSVVSIYAQSGVVPQCAMKVTKSTDAAKFKPYAPEYPCHCFFQKEATPGAVIDGCVACVDSTTCPTGKVCSYGYCE